MNMSYEVRDDYLYVKLMGEFSQTMARGVLLEWIEKARNHTLKRILCDTTLLTGLTAEQTLAMGRVNTGELVARVVPADFKLAVLETPLQLVESQSKYFESIMSNKGMMIKVTDNFYEALQWLDVVQAGKPAGD